MAGYIWKSEKSHKAKPQSKQRRDMLRQHYERLAPREKSSFQQGALQDVGDFVTLVMASGKKKF